MAFKELRERLAKWEKESSRREKILLTLLTLGLPLFLFYQFYYNPSQEKIKILGEDIKSLELEIAKLESFVKKEKELTTQLKERKIFLEEVKLILPTEQEIPKLLKDVSLTAKKNGLEILSFTPKGEEKRDYYNVIPFDIHLKGNFYDILKFLNEVERLPRLVKLNSIELLPQEKEEKLIMKGNFITYKFTGEPLEKQGKK